MNITRKEQRIIQRTLDAWQNSAGYTLKQSGFGKKSP